jgi:hypothetical protein
MDLTSVTYGLYVLISAALTIWVARTLFRSGRRFLIDAFKGDEGLADSVNRLLVVGFYLINIGYVALALKLDTAPSSLSSLIESLSAKIGLVALVVGAMHYGNMAIFARIRVGRPGGKRLTPGSTPRQWTAEPAPPPPPAPVRAPA